MTTSQYFVLKENCQNLFQEIHKAKLPLKIEFRNMQICESFISCILNIQDKILILSLPTSTKEYSPVKLNKWEKEITIYINDSNQKYIFNTTVLKQSQLVTESDELRQTILISMPKSVEVYPCQRSKRISIVPEVAVKIFGLDYKTGSSYHTGKSLQGMLHNISTGGIGVKINKQDLSEIRVGDLFEICFVPVPGEEPMLLNARLRHVTDFNRQQQVLLGLQFTVQTLNEGYGDLLHRLNQVINLYQTYGKKHKLNRR